MKKGLNLIYVFILLINISIQAQIFEGKRDKTNKYDFALKINKDSSAVFLYQSYSKIYAEYNCQIKHVKDSIYNIVGELKFEHNIIKSKNNDSINIFVNQESKKICLPPKDYILFPKSGHTKYLLYFNETKLGYSTPIDTAEFNFKKGKNFIFFQVCRKNPITDTFIDFKIPYGYSSYLREGEKIDFNIIIKKNSIKSYNCKNNFGNFLLKRKKRT